MTTYKCRCGEIHDTSDGHLCSSGTFTAERGGVVFTAAGGSGVVLVTSGAPAKTEVESLREQTANLERRLKEQATSFCDAHAAATKARFEAQLKLDVAILAAVEAEQELTALLLATGEEAMPRPLRARVIRALERVQRIRRTSR